MKIAITGGAGFIGSHLTRAYLNAGHDVLVIDSLVNGSTRAIDPRARFYRIDIRDPKLQTILCEERPDVLSHHAIQRTNTVWSDHSLTDADVHIRGLLNVLDGCVNAAVRKIIFASGGNTLYNRVDTSEFQQGIVPTVKEDAPLFPRSPSDISKVAGEWYIRHYTTQHGLDHTILRYADVYGETDSEFAQHPLVYLTKMLLDNRRPLMRGAASQVHDHIYIDDVVRANLCVLERGKNQTLHISSGQGHDLNQFFYTVAQLLQIDLPPLYVSDLHTEASAIALDNTLAQKLLGWRTEVSFTEGIRLAVEKLLPSTIKVAPQPDVLENIEIEHERVDELVSISALV